MLHASCGQLGKPCLSSTRPAGSLKCTSEPPTTSRAQPRAQILSTVQNLMQIFSVVLLDVGVAGKLQEAVQAPQVGASLGSIARAFSTCSLHHSLQQVQFIDNHECKSAALPVDQRLVHAIAGRPIEPKFECGCLCMLSA